MDTENNNDSKALDKMGDSNSAEIQHYQEQALSVVNRIQLPPIQAEGFWARFRLNRKMTSIQIDQMDTVAEFEKKQFKMAEEFILKLYELFLKGKLLELTVPVKIYGNNILNHYQVQINKSIQDSLHKLDINLIETLKTLEKLELPTRPNNIKKKRYEDTILDYLVAVEKIRTQNFADKI